MTKRLIPGGALSVGGSQTHHFTDRSGRRSDRYFVIERSLSGTHTTYAIGASQ